MSAGHGHQISLGQVLDRVLDSLRTKACCLRKSVNVSSALLLQNLKNAFLRIGRRGGIHVRSEVDDRTGLCVILSFGFGVGHAPWPHAGHVHVASQPLHRSVSVVCGIGLQV